MPRTVASSASHRIKSIKSDQGKGMLSKRMVSFEEDAKNTIKSGEDSCDTLDIAFDEGSFNESGKCSTLIVNENEDETLCGENDALNVAFIEDSPSESSIPAEILSPLSTIRPLRRARPHAPLAYVREGADADIPELHCAPARMPSIFEEAERRPRPKRHLTRHVRRVCFRYAPDLSTIREVSETSASEIDLSSLVQSFYTGFERERYEMRVSIGLHSRRYW